MTAAIFVGLAKQFSLARYCILPGFIRVLGNAHCSHQERYHPSHVFYKMDGLNPHVLGLYQNPYKLYQFNVYWVKQQKSTKSEWLDCTSWPSMKPSIDHRSSRHIHPSATSSAAETRHPQVCPLTVYAESMGLLSEAVQTMVPVAVEGEEVLKNGSWCLRVVLGLSWWWMVVKHCGNNGWCYVVNSG